MICGQLIITEPPPELPPGPDAPPDAVVEEYSVGTVKDAIVSSPDLTEIPVSALMVPLLFTKACVEPLLVG